MKRHSKAKLKGTVLFTVISVMSLLIIFLTSTLVLATSASNRSHKNYSASQAEYTARAAIDSFAEAMERNEAIAQKIVDMGATDVLTPSVEINDSALGEIGYYDNSGDWQTGQILIECVDSAYAYNEEAQEWEEQQVLKVTATAELGGEESTVSLYLRKKSPNEPKPLNIKGLQTAGANNPDATQGYYSGALAMGLTDPLPVPTQHYKLQNGTVIETDTTFVNGSLDIEGGVAINVSNYDTGMVVMGDLYNKNNKFINIDYDMSDKSGSFTQKDIPYLYVDGHFSTGSQLQITDSSGKKAPYNIFCGSWDTWGKAINISNTDLYLMDSGVDNKMGGTSSTRLTAWSSSLVQGGDTQFDSHGGNIYCKGNLELSDTTVYGDVRVEGNVKIGSNVKIYGDLVVGGSITSGNLANTVGGTVYNGTSSTTEYEGLKPGIHVKNNNYYDVGLNPGYYEYFNPIYATHRVNNVQYANYVDDAQYIGIEETNNPMISDANRFREIVLKKEVVSWWPYQEKITDTNGSETDSAGNKYSDIIVGTLAGDAYSASAGSYQWDNNYGTNVFKMYYFDGNYVDYPMYTDAKTNAETPNQHSYYLIKPDGNYEASSADVTIYKADYNGNKSDQTTDSFNVIYKADKDGNALDVETDALYTYYEVDKDGNATDVETSEYFIRYKADSDGNPTDERTSDEYSYYYKMIETRPATRDEAIGNDFWVEWCAPYAKTSAPVYYYDADPTGHENDESWLSSHMVSEADAKQSSVVKAITDYPKYPDIYPTSMTREAITGKDSAGNAYPSASQEYKIVKTLEEMKKAIGYSGSFDTTNIYYTEVPGGTDTFDTVAVGSGETVTIDKNTIITTNGKSTSSGPVVINIKPRSDTIWVVFDGFNLGDNDGHKIFIDDSQGGTVNFFLQNDFYANKIKMETSKIFNNAYIDDSSKININWYGAPGTSIGAGNNSTFIGTAKMPYSKLNLRVSGKYSLNYNGKVRTPAWIGSGLFEEVDTNNNFEMLDVNNGSSTNNTITNDALGVNWGIMYYDAY